MLNDENVTLPELPAFDDAGFNNIVVTNDEVESVLKALPIAMESIIVFSENWLICSQLLCGHYSINPLA